MLVDIRPHGRTWPMDAMSIITAECQHVQCYTVQLYSSVTQCTVIQYSHSVPRTHSVQCTVQHQYWWLYNCTVYCTVHWTVWTGTTSSVCTLAATMHSWIAWWMYASVPICWVEWHMLISVQYSSVIQCSTVSTVIQFSVHWDRECILYCMNCTLYDWTVSLSCWYWS